MMNEQIKALAKELCDKSPCHHKCKDTDGCIVEDDAEQIYQNHLPSALTNKEKVSVKGRYIDAETLLNNLPDDLPYKASVKRVLIQAPSVDVVPKSEVEKIFEEFEQEIKLALTSNYKARIERLQSPKIELADEFMAYCEGKIFALRGIDDFIAELKKKYTESEDKG